MEKKIKKSWIAGFFLPAINATVFTKQLLKIMASYWLDNKKLMVTSLLVCVFFHPTKLCMLNNKSGLWVSMLMNLSVFSVDFYKCTPHLK